MTWVLEDTGQRPLTVNAVAGMHRQRWAAHTSEVRGRWHWLAIEQRRNGLHHLDAIEVTVTPLHRDRRSPQDVSACAPEAKAAIDGLVDAGVVPDDDPSHVVRVTFLPPVVCGVDGMRLEIERATEGDETDG